MVSDILENPGSTGSNRRQEEKFFFNMNNFDDDVVEEEIEEEPEDLPPPPPTFSEEELEAARKEGFAQGHEQAKQEAQESRSKIVAETLQAINESTRSLFSQEQHRESAYEKEAVALCLSAMKKLFPLYNREYGLDEMKDQIEGILQESSGDKTVIVSVNTDYVEGISAFMGKLQEKDDLLRFTVKADENLAPGAVSLTWQDGGAVRDADMMAGKIFTRLEELLAGAGATSHDRGTNISQGSEPLPPESSDVAAEPAPNAEQESMTEDDHE